MDYTKNLTILYDLLKRVDHFSLCSKEGNFSQQIKIKENHDLNCFFRFPAENKALNIILKHTNNGIVCIDIDNKLIWGVSFCFVSNL